MLGRDGGKQKELENYPHQLNHAKPE